MSDEEWRRSLHQPQTATTGVNAIFGKWPGDETDDEIAEALKDQNGQVYVVRPGWLCPRCQHVNAPTVKQCECTP